MFIKSTKILEKIAKITTELAEGNTDVNIELGLDGDAGKISQGLSKIARSLDVSHSRTQELLGQLLIGEAGYRINANELPGKFGLVLKDANALIGDYEAITDAFNFLYIAISPENFTMRHANQGARRVFANNTDLKSLLGTSVHAFFGTDISKHPVIVSAFNNQRKMQHGELELKINGNRKFFDFSCICLTYGADKPANAVGKMLMGMMLLDITEMRNLYEQVVEKTNAERLSQEQMKATAEQLNEYVQRQASAVEESSASIEEMIANINAVSKTLVRNSQNVKELEKASEVGRSSLDEVSADIQEIVRESESLLEINAVMANIASQTNLLSMNAAIEAAHAGDSGRGFAVVANEIRKLAESSSTQSKTIGAVLKKIKGSIEKMTKSTSDVLSKFETMNKGIMTVAEQESNILCAMEEQGQGSKDVLSAISELNKITSQVRETSRRLTS